MSFKNWFLSLFDRGYKSVDISAYFERVASEIYYKDLAVQSCVNLIAGVLSRAEFQTFEAGKEIRRDNYYLFNVEPNLNTSAARFWRDVITRLLLENECLVLVSNTSGMLHIADTFTVDDRVFVERTFRDITIGDLKINPNYKESDVFYFKLHNEEIRSVIDSLYTSYGKLIAMAQKIYKRNNSSRGIVEIKTDYPKTDDAQKDLEKLFGERFKRFFEAEGSAILPLSVGLEYKEIGAKGSGSAAGKTSSTGESQVRAFINDVIDFVCMGFQVPPQLIKGDVADTEQAFDRLMSVCINPLADLLHDEINRKYYGKEKFLARTYVKINTAAVRSHDLKQMAGALETLLRIGGFTIDDILISLGMEPLGTEWSTAHFMTKNYAPVEEFFEDGGDGSEDP